MLQPKKNETSDGRSKRIQEQQNKSNSNKRKIACECVYGKKKKRMNNEEKKQQTV